MKRILVFLGLKVAEVGAFLLVWCLACPFGWMLMDLMGDSPKGWAERYIGAPFALICVCLMVFAVGVLIFFWAHANWKKATSIVKGGE